MRIASAAIKYNGKVYTGWRHCTIGIKMVQDGICPPPYPSGSYQGFVTDSGQFVDRTDAFSIASSAGQIIPELLDGRSILISEMLWDKNGNPVTCMEDYGRASGLSKS